MTVLERVRDYLCEHVGCDPEDVELAATLDELNVAWYDREALAMHLTEVYEIAVPDEELTAFETVEDLVGYWEDRF